MKGLQMQSKPVNLQGTPCHAIMGESKSLKIKNTVSFSGQPGVILELPILGHWQVTASSACRIGSSQSGGSSILRLPLHRIICALSRAEHLGSQNRCITTPNSGHTLP